MKHLKPIGIAVLALTFMSFTALKEKTVNIEKSTITWLGKKVTGQHEGTIKLESGTLNFDGKQFIGGNFVIDMTTITVTDLEGKGKTKLEGHLKSDDFFGVDNHKKASLTITETKLQKDDSYAVTGDLTIKGQTHPITFAMNINGNTATAQVKIDRTKYGIRYGSASFFDNLKDKAIYDEFDLNVNLKF